ncbi:MAG TPA: aldehyde dehydrogenase family protein [Tissierellaceae bacterium]
MQLDKIYINGSWVDSSSKLKLDIENPANMEIFAQVPRCNEEDVNKAVEAAKKSFLPWQEVSLDERIEMMERFIKNLYENTEEIANAIHLELGCSVEFAKNAHFLPYLEDIENFIDEIKHMEFIEDYEKFKVVKEPIGVVGALTPWNYPFGQITKKIAPALLAGNTVVLKPSQVTPISAYYIADAIDKSGFLDGVFNMVPGAGKEVGDIIARHKDVDMISFTGSTQGGIEVSQKALGTVKKLGLELGGKSASVVLEGADLDKVMFINLNSIFLNTGQSCSGLSRLIAPRSMKKELEERLLLESKKYTYGDPSDEKNLLGPLATRKQFDKVKYYIEKGIEEGAELLLGEVPELSEGYFVGPTIFTEVRNDMTIAQDEIFGPVLSVIYYDTVEEAIEIANDSKYGLSGAVFGPEKLANEVASKMRTGMVIINGGLRTHAAPFGGYKQSGLGREGGKWGIEEFLEIKTLF